ncbi:MAG TPA: acyl-CoA dehydrogenase family protein [Acidimicrobiia bacterium]|nr:acyl-CoA dehydrogenase family protein [Acidimicrobiia bacterium]
MSEPTVEDVRAEVRSWLAENWDPDLSVGDWWERLAQSGYAAPTFPEDSFGRGYSRALANVVSDEIRDGGAIGPPSGLGYALAAPTIARHGTQEQKQTWLLRILNGQDAWCQLFSEPGAGSDLASLQCRAELDGDEYVINGQKVWTSTAQLCNLGMLIARTDPDLPKHVGITYFRFDMTQKGVEVRPLREMTGRALFNEVFIDDGHVSAADNLGGVNNGWAVANTTLAAERASLGSGGGGAAGAAFPGPLAGHLERKAGEFVGQVRTGGTGGGGSGMTDRLIGLAKELGRDDDPVVRQGLARLYTLNRIGGFSALRMRGGGASAGAPNIAKLMMSDLLRLNRELGNQIIGADGMLMGEGTAGGGLVQEMTLFSPGPSIYGGTDQVQRNIIGERVLGLPKEPGPDKTTPFRQLLVGTQH